MKKFTKISALLMALVLCLAMWSCGSDDETTMPSLDGEEGDTYSPMDYSKEDLSKYVRVGQYKGLSITRPVVSESELDEYIAMLVESIPSYEKITDRATAEGDYVNISFVGMLDGVAFEGGTSSRFSFCGGMAVALCLASLADSGPHLSSLLLAAGGAVFLLGFLLQLPAAPAPVPEE